MKRTFLMVVGLSIFAGTVVAGTKRPVLPTGAWLASASSKSTTNVHLVVHKKGTFRWNKTSGRWLTKGSVVWFLENKNQVGTKWDFATHRGNLVLRNPEDFKYLGKGKFLYFRFQDPKLVLTFKGATSKRSGVGPLLK